MKPAAFEYRRAGTVPEALALLAQYGDEAKVLAGGQSLVPLMAFRLARPELLVDINDLTELAGVRWDDGSMIIGTLTRQDAMLRSRPPGWDVVREAVGHIGHYPIRKRGTVGGSLAHADPAAELPVLALALDGQMTLRSSCGERRVGATDFFHGHFTTALRPNELLTEICFPPRPVGCGAAFEEFSRRKGDFALVSAAVAVARDASGKRRYARIALGGVADTPVRAMNAEQVLLDTPGPEGIERAAREATAEIEPPTDVHATSQLRLELVRTLVARALARAEEEAA
ncbi:MAG: xanthine dehydrogenase family protein subunit M [Chloroflexota bacterium]|nr:xanthine dehydrogenase family protein subunit M [Chloroflexota bacterium]